MTAYISPLGEEMPDGWLFAISNFFFQSSHIGVTINGNFLKTFSASPYVSQSFIKGSIEYSNLNVYRGELLLFPSP